MSKKKLLLADDSVTIQRVIELTFADENITVVAVGDGRQAIERLDRDVPDIVLADVSMPHVDGYGVATFMKSTPALAKVPLILLAGAFDPIDEARARALGCDGVLAKPFEPQQVIARVRQLIAHGKDGGAGGGWSTGSAAGTSGQTQPAGAPSADTPNVLADFAFQQPAHAGRSGSASMDDYFDRLDRDLSAASSPEPSPVLAPAAPPDATPSKAASIMQDWFPRTTPASPAPRADDTPTLVRAAATERPPAATFAGPPDQRGHGLAIADAFAALLAAEQGDPAPTPQFVPPDEKAIEAIVARVLERMTADRVPEIVTRVAERLVREEIARLRNGG